MKSEPNQQGNGPTWRSGAAVGLLVTAVVGATLGWLTGVNSKLDAHNLKIQGLEVQSIQHGKQLDRIEQKLDRFQEERKRP